MMSTVIYAIYGCSSATTTPGVSPYRSLSLVEKIVAVITQDILKRQIKNRFFYTAELLSIPSNLNFSV